MSLTQQILDATSKGSAELKEGDRSALLQATHTLAQSLETPLETFLRRFMGIYEPIVIRIALDLNLIDIALAHGAPITVAELASKSNADPELVQRILNMLVGMNIFTQAADSKYEISPSGYTLAAGSPLREAAIHITFGYPGVANLPEFLAESNYANVNDASHAPLTTARGFAGSNYFEVMARPDMERFNTAFNVTMALNKAGEEETFVKAYPAAERLRIEDPERVLLVDVGGGFGHQLAKFDAAYADLPGKLVLQDFEETVNGATVAPEKTIKVGHDFFKPQPETVRNAKAFYLRNILHDWPDKQAKPILQNIVDVMADDSVVLINDAILPEGGVDYSTAVMDWHMMQLGALERTENQWKKLVESIGLEIKNIWWEEESIGRRALIECVKSA